MATLWAYGVRQEPDPGGGQEVTASGGGRELTASARLGGPSAVNLAVDMEPVLNRGTGPGTSSDAVNQGWAGTEKKGLTDDYNLDKWA